MQKIFTQETIKKKKLNKDIVLTIYCSKFLKKVYQNHEYQLACITQQVKTDYLCHRFIRILEKNYA